MNCWISIEESENRSLLFLMDWTPRISLQWVLVWAILYHGIYSESSKLHVPEVISSRYKLKFSPDKVDIMVIQAISLLDDLDKEINIYSMRVKVSILEFLVIYWLTELRNGTGGISRKWQRSSPTIWPMRTLFVPWVSEICPHDSLYLNPLQVCEQTQPI